VNFWDYVYLLRSSGTHAREFDHLFFEKCHNYKLLFGKREGVLGLIDRPKGVAAGLQPPQKQNLKNTDFVDTMISKVLLDLHLSLNQPLKSGDD
jgi:hypothetical protein